MESLKVTDLKALSKTLELRGYSRLRKSDLIKLIMDHLNSRPKLIPRPRSPKPTRPPLPPPTRPMLPPWQPRPPPIPLGSKAAPCQPPRPSNLRPYRLKDKGSKIGDVQPPTEEAHRPAREYNPKKLKRMKRDLVELKKKIRRSRKRSMTT